MIDTTKSPYAQVKGLELAKLYIHAIMEASQALYFEPLPDDEYRIYVKPENDLWLLRLSHRLNIPTGK